MGFPVFGSAQPTKEGFLKALEKLPKVRKVYFLPVFL